MFQSFTFSLITHADSQMIQHSRIILPDVVCNGFSKELSKENTLFHKKRIFKAQYMNEVRIEQYKMTLPSWMSLMAPLMAQFKNAFTHPQTNRNVLK